MPRGWQPALRRARLTGSALLVIAGCASSSGGNGSGGSDAGDFPACAATLADFCAESGALCPMTWDAASSLLGAPQCAGGIYLYACQGLDVASCPGDEGGGHTLVFDPSSHALVAIVAYPSIVPGGNPGCYLGPASLRSSLQAGPPSCPTGPLLGPPGIAADAGE